MTIPINEMAGRLLNACANRTSNGDSACRYNDVGNRCLFCQAAEIVMNPFRSGSRKRQSGAAALVSAQMRRLLGTKRAGVATGPERKGFTGDSNGS